MRRLVCAASVTAALWLAGCGSTEITASTSCDDYLQQPGDKRHDAAVRLSSEAGVDDAGNPMWGLSLDYSCGSKPKQTIGDYFDRQAR